MCVYVSHVYENVYIHINIYIFVYLFIYVYVYTSSCMQVPEAGNVRARLLEFARPTGYKAHVKRKKTT